MTCKKCGYVTNDKVLACPKCGARINEMDVVNDIKVKNSVDNIEKTSSSTDSSIFPILIGIVFVVIVVSILLIVYMNKEESDYNVNQNSNIIKYKENGYSFIDLYTDIDNLETFSLINEDYSLIDSTSYNASKLFCNMFPQNKISLEIDNGILTIKDETSGYFKVVNSINDAKFVIGYNKMQCECNDYNIVVLTKDGYLYIYEGVNLDYSDIRNLIDDIADGFNEISTSRRIRSIAVTSYVGDVNPCGEKTLLLIDERNEKSIYRENISGSTTANYSTVIYNVGSVNDENYSLYINPDRTIQIGTEYSENNRYITDSKANKIRYYGAFKDENESEMIILTTNGYLYTVNFGNELSNITASLVRNLEVSNIGYKFDMKEMKNKYVIIYGDGSVREYTGSFETHGIFSAK